MSYYRTLLSWLPGLLVCGVIAFLSTLLHSFWPPAGAAVIAMFLGMILRLFRRIPESVGPGLDFTSRKLLKTAIILLGGSLSLGQLLRAGGSSLLVMIFTLTAGFLTAWLIGKYLLGLSFNQRNLIAVGTGICGGSAIAALSPVLDADDKDIAFAISATFLFDVLAVVVFPVAGQAMGLSDYGYGLWAGTAVNDTSSVVAAGYAFSEAAGNYAAVVKMARTTMLLPVGLLLNLALIRRSRKGKGGPAGGIRLKNMVPWFVLLFAAVVLLNTAFPFPAWLSGGMKSVSAFVITMALAAIGLKTDLMYLLKAGKGPLLLGGIVSLVVVFVSLGVQVLLGLV